MQAKEEEDKMVELLTQAFELVKHTKYPTTNEDREKFFMDMLQTGEVLARKGILLSRLVSSL